MIVNNMTVNDQEVLSLFRALTVFGADLSGPLGDIGDAMVQSTKLRFDAGVDPRGQRWQALAWATVIKRASRGRSMRRGGKLVARSGFYRAAFQRQVSGDARPLMDTRTHLYNSLTYRLDVDGAGAVIVGVAAAWARVHQYGGMAGRGNRVRIPQREIFGLSLEDRREVIGILGGYLGRQITGY